MPHSAQCTACLTDSCQLSSGLTMMSRKRAMADMMDPAASTRPRVAIVPAEGSAAVTAHVHWSASRHGACGGVLRCTCMQLGPFTP